MKMILPASIALCLLAGSCGEREKQWEPYFFAKSHNVILPRGVMLALEAKKDTLAVGDTLILRAAPIPSDTNVPFFVWWWSKEKNIVKVNYNTGRVEALAVGTAKVRATYVHNATWYDEATIIVEEPKAEKPK